MLTIKPKTRKEIYLAYLSGDMSLELPEPLTRDEVNLYNLCKNKAYGEYTTVKEVLAECQPEMDDEGSFVIDSGAPVLTAGETYIVDWNGTEYTCAAQDLSALQPGLYLLGNGANYGFAGNGEPFAIVGGTNDEGITSLQMGPLDGSTTLTISIRQEVTEVKKISGKYVEGMGWSETGSNIFDGSTEYPNFTVEEGSNCFYLVDPKLNLNKSYDFIIRGDVYKNVSCEKVNSYYDYAIWGSAYGNNTNYPFYLVSAWEGMYDYDGNPTWDSDGNWVCEYGNVDYWAYPHIEIDTEKYPDLTIDEIQIMEPEIIHPIDPKFLPSGGNGGGGGVHAFIEKQGNEYALYLETAYDGAFVPHMALSNGFDTFLADGASISKMMSAYPADDGTIVMAFVDAKTGKVLRLAYDENNGTIEVVGAVS